MPCKSLIVTIENQRQDFTNYHLFIRKRIVDLDFWSCNKEMPPYNYFIRTTTDKLGNDVVMILNFVIAKKFCNPGIRWKITRQCPNKGDTFINGNSINFIPVYCQLRFIFQREVTLVCMAQKSYLINNKEWCIISSSHTGPLLLPKSVSYVDHNITQFLSIFKKCPLKQTYFRIIILPSIFVENNTGYIVR